MLDIKEKDEIWQRVSKEFPSVPMMRNLHFIRELMDVIEKTSTQPRTLKEISLLARKEFEEWLKIHPEFQSGNI